MIDLLKSWFSMAMFKLRVLIINSETNINQSVWSLIGFWEIGKTNQNMGVVYAIYRDILATSCDFGCRHSWRPPLKYRSTGFYGYCSPFSNQSWEYWWPIWGDFYIWSDSGSNKCTKCDLHAQNVGTTKKNWIYGETSINGKSPKCLVFHFKWMI